MDYVKGQTQRSLRNDKYRLGCRLIQISESPPYTLQLTHRALIWDQLCGGEGYGMQHDIDSTLVHMRLVKKRPVSRKARLVLHPEQFIQEDMQLQRIMGLHWGELPVQNRLVNSKCTDYEIWGNQKKYAQISHRQINIWHIHQCYDFCHYCCHAVMLKYHYHSLRRFFFLSKMSKVPYYI